MEVVKAEPVIESLDDSSDDETLYQYQVELIEIDKLLLSVFNVQTGITFKTYIHKDDEWFKSNIYIFHGDFNKAITILQNSLLRDVSSLPHTEKEGNEELIITINYADAMYPFQLQISVPKFVSKNGPLDDRMNALEYQVTKLKKKIKQVKKETNKVITDEIYNSVGNLVYKGEMKDGKRHGRGTQYYEECDHVLYEGEFKGGYYDGVGVLTMIIGLPGSDAVRTAGGAYLYESWSGQFHRGVFNGPMVQQPLFIQKGLAGERAPTTHHYTQGIVKGALCRSIIQDDGRTR